MQESRREGTQAKRDTGEGAHVRRVALDIAVAVEMMRGRSSGRGRRVGAVAVEEKEGWNLGRRVAGRGRVGARIWPAK